jgi:hypothetical protein
MSDPRGLTVMELIHQLSNQDPTERPIIYTRYFTQDITDRRCVVTQIRSAVNGIHVEFEPEEWPPHDE